MSLLQNDRHRPRAARRLLRPAVVAAGVAMAAGTIAAPAGAVGLGPQGQAPIPSTATGASVAAPTVTGPVASTTPVGDPAHGYPFLATDVDLASAGYVEQEFFISGQATRYAQSGTSTATVTSTGHPYSTRIVVRKPTDAKKFNGVVVAEWINVSNQWDQEVDWFQSHEHFLREGYAWVGVSAQRVGVHSATGLKAWSPARYGSLDVTAGGTINDDTLSYDIFSQAVKAVRSPAAGVDPLGSLPAPQYVIATGHSQSAGRLANYYNGILPLSNILDAVVLHGGGGVLRTGSTRPVFRINSEGDVASGILSVAARQQPDSPVLRSWEVAGASHGDWKLITDYGPLRKRDIGTYPGGYPGEPQTCALPSLSRVPQHMVQNAVYDHTVDWVAYGAQPPTAPKITTEPAASTTVVRDGLGLALGGIRLAQHEAPLRVNSGSNTGPGFCFLDGSSLPLTDAQLAALYPTVQSYVDEFVATTLANAAAGYIPGNFTRDPAWYSDLRELIEEHAAAGRIAGHVEASLLDRLDRAERLGLSGSESRTAGYLQHLVDRARNQIKGDAAAREAVVRSATALIALLDAVDGTANEG
ncbi:alpha/beta hydrolase domain-containing protein [Motilibacter aurantiacus]|uniref:alpha/beta hydrolase domain-containing protein n=1 Tax=Motilibacter aurantiacus TaxID=2714955 RepID=UPI001409DB22|nr:alpha/beta hydrolase domain-containing protein [Motilibacter aurantiacus]NHC44309.1 hypothetical protein [Motilibacter aurantiacus]